MRIPPEVRGELASLRSTRHLEQNLLSIAVVRDWIESTLETLRQRRPNLDGRPRLAHRHKGVAALTDSSFDGIETATLRYWLKWWEDPARSPHGGEEAGREPQVEAAKIRRELDARRAARDA